MRNVQESQCKRKMEMATHVPTPLVMEPAKSQMLLLEDTPARPSPITIRISEDTMAAMRRQWVEKVAQPLLWVRKGVLVRDGDEADVHIICLKCVIEETPSLP